MDYIDIHTIFGGDDEVLPQNKILPQDKILDMHPKIDLSENDIENLSIEDFLRRFSSMPEKSEMESSEEEQVIEKPESEPEVEFHFEEEPENPSPSAPEGADEDDGSEEIEIIECEPGENLIDGECVENEIIECEPGENLIDGECVGNEIIEPEDTEGGDFQRINDLVQKYKMDKQSKHKSENK